MTNLTPAIVLATIKNDKRIDQAVEWDEPGKAMPIKTFTMTFKKFEKTYNFFVEMGASREDALKLAKIVFTIVTK